MHEEARICHLIEGRQGGDQNGDTAVAEQAGEEEVLRVTRLQYRSCLIRARIRTKRVMARVYKTRIKRNLKKCAASCARPAIQYVLQDDQ